jgi:uridine kinase
MQSPLIIGITGGSGSGKTYFLKQLAAKLPAGSTSILTFDNYYRPINQQQKDENGIENFDLPESLDIKRFITDLNSLKNGQDVFLKEYTFNNTNKIPSSIHIKAAPILLIEGIFTFHFTEIFNLLSVKIFIDAPEELMLRRRITRDAEERGYDLDDVKYRFENHVLPAFQKFIAPKKTLADLIIPNFNGFEKALEVVKIYAVQHLSSQ